MFGYFIALGITTLATRTKKMEKNVLPKFDCFSDPATIGPGRMRWLTSFEPYADGKGLIIREGTTAATKRRRRAMLLHLVRPGVKEIFTL